jgi:hypothetical protein
MMLVAMKAGNEKLPHVMLLYIYYMLGVSGISQSCGWLGGWLPFQSCSCGVKKEQIEVWRWISLSLIDE